MLSRIIGWFFSLLFFSLSLSFFWSIKFTLIFHFIPLIYTRSIRAYSRPLNNRCPENWFVTLYLHAHATHAHAYNPLFFLSSCLFLSCRPVAWRRIHATICLVEHTLSSHPSLLLLSAHHPFALRPYVSTDICFIVFHVLFEINNTPPSVPFFSILYSQARTRRGGSSLHSISHIRARARARLPTRIRTKRSMFSTLSNKQNAKYLDRLFLSSFD